ncbi:CD63 antigen-like protein [Dinothrombium tinctorium]|uniref:CD63 antigen-like protein n=2 Tax=Dinothrombium tinctorium TaxID=1965070 RepID=A0A443QAT4_9ACAR|nr:CD63 antigen-like protein [Dinothrombium tinctorium]
MSALSKVNVFEKGQKILSILMIVTGFLLFSISLAGFWAAFKESKNLLYTYGAIIAGLAIYKIVLAFFLIAIISKNPEIFRDKIMTSMKKYPLYKVNDENKIIIDDLQWQLSCCGWLKGPKDWNDSNDWKNKFRGYADRLPRSCCFNPKVERKKVCTMKAKSHFKTGCAIKIERIIFKIFTFTCSFLTVFSMIQLAAACFACMLGAAIV